MIAASADPAQFSIGPGESRTVQFAFDPTGARIDEYVDGAVILTNEQDGRTVRLPVVLRPEQFEAAEQLNFGAVAADGQAPLAVPTGYQGDLSAQGYGFAPPGPAVTRPWARIPSATRTRCSTSLSRASV